MKWQWNHRQVGECRGWKGRTRITAIISETSDSWQVVIYKGAAFERLLKAATREMAMQVAEETIAELGGKER